MCIHILLFFHETRLDMDHIFQTFSLSEGNLKKNHYFSSIYSVLLLEIFYLQINVLELPSSSHIFIQYIHFFVFLFCVVK